MFAGRASGVQVTTSNGIIGEAPRIRVRGVASIGSGTYPLVVVDGIDAGAQLKGILATIVIAIIAGLFTGKVVSLFGQPIKIYDDEAEFETEDSE